MKGKHNIVLIFYIVTDADDTHTAEQMRALGESGVYEPTFFSGERKMLSMAAKFDEMDEEACMSACIYALRNAKELYPNAKIMNVETYINGIIKGT